MLRIQLERVKRGWLQKDVAKKVGVNANAISMIENGVRRAGYDLLCKLEDLFNLSHRALFKVIEEEDK